MCFCNNIARGYVPKLASKNPARYLCRHACTWGTVSGVDSLCIIQDDRYDWNKEAVLIGSVYKRAILTILATSSVAFTTGYVYLASRTPPWHCP